MKENLRGQAAESREAASLAEQLVRQVGLQPKHLHSLRFDPRLWAPVLGSGWGARRAEVCNDGIPGGRAASVDGKHSEIDASGGRRTGVGHERESGAGGSSSGRGCDTDGSCVGDAVGDARGSRHNECSASGTQNSAKQAKSARPTEGAGWDSKRSGSGTQAASARCGTSCPCRAAIFPFVLKLMHCCMSCVFPHALFTHRHCSHGACTRGFSWVLSVCQSCLCLCSAAGAPGGPLWGAWWQRRPARAAGAFERLDAVLETYTDVTRFPRCGSWHAGALHMAERSG